MNNTAARAKLPAYRVHLSDGSSYVTSMAANVTLSDAQAYFEGMKILNAFEDGFAIVTHVTAADPSN
jgi:hypothetical protein